MWGSTIPTVYYGFFSNPELQRAYWTMVGTSILITQTDKLNTKQISVLALGCIIATLNPRFRHPTLRPYRAAMYSGLGLSAIIFIAHGILIYGWTIEYQRMSLGWMGLMMVLNLIGAIVYATRVCYLVKLGEQI